MGYGADAALAMASAVAPSQGVPSSSLAPTDPDARKISPENDHGVGSVVVAPEVMAIVVGVSSRLFL